MTNEYSCTCVHSDRMPDERRDNLQKFKVGVHTDITTHSNSPL